MASTRRELVGKAPKVRHDHRPMHVCTSRVSRMNNMYGIYYQGCGISITVLDSLLSVLGNLRLGYSPDKEIMTHGVVGGNVSLHPGD